MYISDVQDDLLGENCSVHSAPGENSSVHNALGGNCSVHSTLGGNCSVHSTLGKNCSVHNALSDIFLTQPVNSEANRLCIHSEIYLTISTGPQSFLTYRKRNVTRPWLY